MTVYRENLRESADELLGVIRSFSKVSGYRIDTD